MVVVTDTTTRAELAETITHVNAAAKRLPHVMGVTGPSKWDLRHECIDRLLVDWQAAGS